MRTTFLTVALIVSALLSACAQPPLAGGAEISFTQESHDFGSLNAGDPAVVEFAFTNSGTEPLIISNAKKSCGCTVPEWPRDPIAPGKTGKIKVSYDSKRIGPFSKTVTITSNAIDSPTVVLKIKGNVSNAEPKS